MIRVCKYWFLIKGCSTKVSILCSEIALFERINVHVRKKSWTSCYVDWVTWSLVNIECTCSFMSRVCKYWFSIKGCSTKVSVLCSKIALFERVNVHVIKKSWTSCYVDLVTWSQVDIECMFFFMIRGCKFWFSIEGCSTKVSILCPEIALFEMVNVHVVKMSWSSCYVDWITWSLVDIECTCSFMIRGC